jgi:glyoxylase-like metal-dependent hydrolase (beta-lactamase superfamily II)
MRLADRWFQRKRISDDMTLLWEPHVHPLLRCNIWHIAGRDQDLLIDTGVGVASLADEIQDLLDKPLVALATHIHYDHVGSLHEFDQRVMHSAEAHRMATYDEFASLCMAHFPDNFLADFADPTFDDYLINAIPSDEFVIEEFQIQPTEATRIVEDGDIVDLGNRHFEVMHLPGHSPGSIGLYEQASETLFSGDAIYDGLLLDDLPDSDIGDYLTTMARLRKLPVRVVHGGHESSFDGRRLVELIDEYVASRS